jgi:cell division protein FtsQ
MYNKPLEGMPRWKRVLRTLLFTLMPPLVLGLVVGAVFWVRSGSTFRLRAWHIEGDLLSARQDMTQVLARYENKPLASLSVDKVRQELARDPWITGLSVVKNWPDALDVQVREAEPLAWVVRRGAVKVLSGDGRLLPAPRASLTLDMPVLKVPDAQLPLAVGALRTLKTDFPALYGRVEWVEWSAFPRLGLMDSPARVTLQAPLWRHGLSMLQVVLSARPEMLTREGEMDLRFVNQVVWRRANA